MKNWVTSTYRRTIGGHYTGLETKYPLVDRGGYEITKRIGELVEVAFQNKEVLLYCEDNGHDFSIETPVGMQCNHCKVLNLNEEV